MGNSVGNFFRHPSEAGIVDHRAVTLQPPKAVHPAIRGTRWALLVAGIAFGYLRWHVIANKHIDVREYEHVQQLAEEAKQHKIAKWKAAEDMEILAKNINLPWNDETKKLLGLSSGEGHH